MLSKCKFFSKMAPTIFLKLCSVIHIVDTKTLTEPVFPKKIGSFEKSKHVVKMILNRIL